MTDYTKLPSPNTGRELYKLVLKVAHREGYTSITGFDIMWDPTPVAYYSKTNSDGCDVIILASAAPAQFYQVVPLNESGIVLSTGSGSEAGEWSIQTAKLIANGMLVPKIGYKVKVKR